MDIKILFLLGVLVSYLPAEPSEQYLVKEEVDTVVGFYFREYAVLSNGQVNYRTARQLPQLGFDDYAYSIAASSKPLFYWFDCNQNGTFDEDEIWIDSNTDGLSIRKY